MTAIGRRIQAGLITLTGTGPGVAVVLALLVMASVFVAVATPRASLAFRTRALQRIFQSTAANGKTVLATSGFAAAGLPAGSVPGSDSNKAASGLESVGALIRSNLTAAQLPLQPASAQWTGLASSYSVAADSAKSAYDGSMPPEVEVLWRDALGRFSRLAAGKMPGTDAYTPKAPRLQVAVTAATAARFSLRPGSVLRIAGISEPVTLVVSGILRPTHQGSSFWRADPDASGPTFNQTRNGAFWLGAVFIPDSEILNMQAAFGGGQMTLTWEIPLALGGVNADQASVLNDELSRAITTAGVLTKNFATSPNIAVSSGVAGALTEFVQTDGEITSLLSLLYISLATVGAVVLLLAARMLAERRASEFFLLQARGAARWQLAVLALRAAVVAVIPAAAMGGAAGVALTSGADEPLAWWLATLTTLIALAGVPMLAVRRVRGPADERADSVPTRTMRARRAVIDATMVAAAIGGLIVLRQQGPPPPGSTDWYTSASPVFVAVPLAVIVVRLYPVIVRWLARLAGRRYGVTAFIGLARAARTSMTTVLPAFALVLVLGVTAFGATLRAAVIRGDILESWRSTGADAVIDASHSNAPVTAAAQRAIAAVDGVTRTSALSVQSGVAADGTIVGVIIVNPASYAALIADTPGPPFPAAALAQPAGSVAASRLPVLASPGAAAAISAGKVLLGTVTIRVRSVGAITSTPGSVHTGPFIVLPTWAAARTGDANLALPNELLAVGPRIDESRLRSAVSTLLPGATVTFRSTLLASLTGALLPHGAYVAFADGVAAAAGYGAVIVLIMLALGARPRELTLARLFTMGLSPGQARGVLIVEALPSILASAAGGAACAWLLVPLIGPAVDLSPLTGSSAPVPVQANLQVIGYLAACLVVLATAILFAQSAMTRLRSVARALRVGE